MNGQALRSAYDVIIVGGGMGGITAAALLAKEGKQVLLVEQEKQPGGFIREFSYGPYLVNPAIHSIMGCNPAGTLGQGVIDAVLDHLGVQDLCQFVPVNPFYRVQFPEFQMDVPTGREAYLDAFERHFPGETDGLRKLVDLNVALFRELMDSPAVLRWQDWLLMPFRSPKTFRYANSTLAAVMDRYLSDPRMKSVYAVLYPYLALPPSQLPFSIWAVMMAGYIEQGAFYCNGGFQKVADALATAVTNQGGEVLLGTRVNKIMASGGRVQGVMLEDGQAIASPLVISNIDARATFNDLLEPGQTPLNYVSKLQHMEPSIAVLAMALGTDLNIGALGVPKVTMVSTWDLEEAFAVAMKGHVAGAAVHIPTVIDPSLAPPGEHLVIVQANVPVGTELSPAAGAHFAGELLGVAEKVLPGLSDHINFVAGADEEGAPKFPLLKMGPIYGWANTISQSGPRRLPYKTPLAGLYLTGHWTQPGSGVWTVVLSGINAARFAMGKRMADAIWPLQF